jgi:regulator of sigma E protease
VFISINLGIINLLPIPILDGGHIVYLVIEAVRKKPLSLKTLEIAQRIGFAFLILIMFLAVYNDIARLNVFEKIAELFR